MCRCENTSPRRLKQRFYSTFLKFSIDNMTANDSMKFRNKLFENIPPSKLHFKYNILLIRVFSCLNLSMTPDIFDALLKL